MTVYGEKPWLEHYDPETPVTLEPYPLRTVHELLEAAADTVPKEPATIMSAHLPLMGRKFKTTSYEKLNHLSNQFAHFLIGQGITQEDRVAIILPNCTQFAIAFFGILKAGAIAVPINPTDPPAKLADRLNTVDVKIAIILSSFYKGLQEVRDLMSLQQIIVTNIKEYLPPIAQNLFTLFREKRDGHYVEQLEEQDSWFQDVLRSQPLESPTQSMVSPHDTALFQFTGGTSGEPKAVRLSHQSITINSRQIISYLPERDQPQSSLGAAPFFHVYGLIAVLVLTVDYRAPLYMVPNPRDTIEVMRQIEFFKPTVYMGVPTLYNRINQHPAVAQYDLSSISVCISGAAPLAQAIKDRFEELTGGKLSEGYGMTELAVATHCNPLNGENRIGSIGLPMTDVECRIVSLDDGTTLMPIGQIGEMIVRTPGMMSDYYQLPDETHATLRDGWVFTGDVAYMDEDGYFYIVDRKKDVVFIGGYNVYPNQVEKVIMGNPLVAACGVAGVPHPTRTGEETLKAWVQLHEENTLTASDLIKYCENYLSPHEVPRRIEFVLDLPVSTTGKVLRRELVLQESI